MMTSLVKVTILYMAGIALGFNFPLDYVYYLAGGIVSFSLLLVVRPRWKTWCFCLAIMLLAGFWTSFNYEYRETALQNYYGKDLKLAGLVNMVGRADKKFVQVDLKRVNDQPVKAKVRLYSSQKMAYQNGDYLVWQGSLASAPKNYNPCDKADYWLTNDIEGFSFLKKEISYTRNVHWLSYINSWKEKAFQRMKRVLPAEMASIVAGMLFGDGRYITSSWEAAFQKTGLIHILAASGQNIFFLLLLSDLFCSLTRLPVWASNLISGLAILFYMAIVGFSAPVVRAGIMALLFLLGRVIQRQISGLHILFFSVLLMLLYSPLELFNLSFQLSFGAVLSLFIFTPFWERRLNWLPGKVKEAVAAVLAVECGLTPLLLYYFQGVSLVSMVMNLLVGPFLDGVLFLGFFLVFFGYGVLGYSLGGLIYILLYPALVAIKIVADPSLCYLEAGGVSLMVLLLYYSFWGIFLWSPPKMRRKNLMLYFVLAILILLYQFISGLFPSDLKVTFLDVGQGDCILIQTPEHKNIIIDGGPRNPVRTLENQGIRKVDVLLITHFDEDHFRGGVEILRSLPVKLVLADMRNGDENGDFWQLVKNYRLVYEGDTVDLGSGVKLEIIYPEREKLEHMEDKNDSSLVCRLVYKNFSLLLTGDLEEKGEKELLTENVELASDVLKVGHHGSISSTSPEFLEAVSPKMAVISVGRHNRFGHPRQKILERLKENDVTIYRTDKQGAIIVESDGKSYQVKTVRDGTIKGS